MNNCRQGETGLATDKEDVKDGQHPEQNQESGQAEEGAVPSDKMTAKTEESAAGEQAKEGLSPPRRRSPGGESEPEEEAEDFGSMFEQSLRKREHDEGEIIRGTVVDIAKDHIMVDIGGKSEGQVPIGEFTSASGEVEVQVGQEIEVLVERRDEENGIIRLSKDKAEKRRIWEELEEAHKNETPVKGRIMERVKGGLMVDIGIKAFLPGSQADLRPLRNLDTVLGEDDYFQIIKFNRKRGNVVVSRRTVLEKDLHEKREKTLAGLEKDQVIRGVVKNITEYGAFVDLGGIDGLLHITDMSYGRINHPTEVIKVEEEITVKVLKFNRESEKVSLGLKQILPDPWDNIEKKYPVGTIVTGKAVSATDYGIFIELEKGVEGLVHVSELSWSKKRSHPSKQVEPDQELEAKVLSIDPVNRRISLSIKQAQPNPWDMLEIKYPVGSRIHGKVRNITNFGVFVGVEEGIDGLVHISDLSWTRRVKHPSELFKKGQEVDCVVLKIEKDNERFSLGIKQAQPDPWESVPDKYRPGGDAKGRVVNITDFGVFVELEEGIEGLIHISELSREKVNDPTELVQIGQEISAEILNVDISERKIRLSVKALERAEQDVSYQKYKKQEGDGTSKLGELIQDKLSKVKVKDLHGVPAVGEIEPEKAGTLKKDSSYADQQETGPTEEQARPEGEGREEEAEPTPDPETEAAEANQEAETQPVQETAAEANQEAEPQPAPETAAEAGEEEREPESPDAASEDEEKA